MGTTWLQPRRRLTGHLAAAQVSRRLVVHAVPVVLTVLAVGATTLSGLYAATSGGLRDALSDVGQGADVRARLAPAPTPQDTLVTVPDVSDVPHSAQAPVWRAETRLGQTDAQLTVLPVDRLEEVALLPQGSLDPGAVSAALRPGGTDDPAASPRDAIALPDGPLSLELTVSVTTRAHPDFVRSTQQQGEAHERELRENPESVVVGAGEVSEEMVEDLIEDHWRWLGTLGQGSHELRPTLQVVDPHTVGPQTLTLEPLRFPFHWEVVQRQIRAEERTETTTLRLELPDGTDRTLTGLRLGLPQWSVPYDVTVTLEGLTTSEGTDLLAQRPAVDWSTPEPAGQPATGGDYREGPGSTDLEVTHDSSRGTLVVSGTSGMAGNQPMPTRDAVDTVPVTADPESKEPVVPVAVTPALVRANDLVEGQQVELRAFGLSVPGTVAAVVPSVPGTLQPEAVLVDQAALADYLLAAGQQAPRPTEFWLATEDADATQQALGGVPGLGQVMGPGSVEVTDAASAVRLVFWVASAGAVLLAATGIAAVTATLLSGRRPEVAVLRALGAPAALQARSRALELLGVVCAALLAGLVAGWTVGALVVPELARSTTLPGQVSLPAALALELPLWLVLLGVLMLAVAVTATVTATRVRAQALDTEYREEIR
ncbi:FtsX-like permease family protein [Ornithinicoccus halotolerans]|uniref:FtsX-like permease family protein n=1 Tax=Ornithinicoccus halotolerans TaxID=1748220 RepID=UPI0012956072|nr:FtsX-like permease family protein [Ornithinicoccus halotolerans]